MFLQNPRIYDTTDVSAWTGTVVNKTKGTTLALVQNETPFVYADLSKYGDGPVFYFKTEVGDDDFLDTPKAGDEIVVTLTGLKKLDGTPATISYTVRLFAF